MSPDSLDLRDFFYRLSYRYTPEALEAKKRLFKSSELIVALTHCLTYAPVIEDRSGFFQIDPTPRPRTTAWRWIIAARWCEWDDECLWRGCGISRAQREALNGHFVEDLVACDQNLARVTARLRGSAAVVGWPLAPYLAQRPVRVHESPLSWLLSYGEGVFLCGDPEEQQTWLRACAAGLHTSTLAMGEALRKKMIRPIPALPPILVDA